MHRDRPAAEVRYMILKTFLLSAILATFPAGIHAQNTIPASATDASVRLSGLERALSRLLETDEDEPSVGSTRPRVVSTASDVAASVVVNTIAAERIAFDIINRKRIENGAAPLAWNEELAEVARLHSRNMAEFHFFSHRGLDNKFVSDRADQLKLRNWRAIGENIAFNRGFDDPIAKAVELWLGSQSHRRNLLDAAWKESAVGIAVADDGSYYLTQVFLVRR
jgi:uncharacterized protein YkwD